MMISTVQVRRDGRARNMLLVREVAVRSLRLLKLLLLSLGGGVRLLALPRTISLYSEHKAHYLLACTCKRAWSCSGVNCCPRMPGIAAMPCIL